MYNANNGTNKYWTTPLEKRENSTTVSRCLFSPLGIRFMNKAGASIVMHTAVKSPNGPSSTSIPKSIFKDSKKSISPSVNKAQMATDKPRAITVRIEKFQNCTS